MLDILIVILLLSVLVAVLWFGFRLNALVRSVPAEREELVALLDARHRAMLNDLHEGLARQSDRLGKAIGEGGDRLRGMVSSELYQTRDVLQALQLAQRDSLAQTREAVLGQLAVMAAQSRALLEALRAELSENVARTLTERGRADRELIQSTMAQATQSLSATVELLTKTVDARLERISTRVGERLDEGFKKTNETFVSVMARLATIDEAQRKIDGLTSNVVSLQELLGDKRSRGAFGEVQLENLVRNLLPPSAYAMQASLPNGTRVDCALFLPEPTGTVCVDSKFPLENYHRMFAPALGEQDRALAQKQFRLDVRRHVDAIADKYIVAGETSDGAVMFIPAEAVFAEIHAYHPEVVDYAMGRRVWIVSPTTMMAVLNTARAVLKDVETRKQVHVIRDALHRLGKEFERFDARMKKLADHIRLAHEDVVDVHTTSRKITDRFRRIESADLGEGSRESVEGFP